MCNINISQLFLSKIKITDDITHVKINLIFKPALQNIVVQNLFRVVTAANAIKMFADEFCNGSEHTFCRILPKLILCKVAAFCGLAETYL